MSAVETLRRIIREICGSPTTDLEDVLATAQMAHMGQTRRSGEPYITHPEAVADIVYAYYGDKSLCAAAILHDTLEDAPRWPTEGLLPRRTRGTFSSSKLCPPWRSHGFV